MKAPSTKNPTAVRAEPSVLPPEPGALVAVDAAVVALFNAAICLASRRWLLMTVLVPALLATRFVAVALLARRFSIGLRAEAVFFAACTALGALNDWNSVCNHGIYVAGSTAELSDPVAWAGLGDRLYRKDWVVYAKPPFGGPEQVFKYLDRYAHRVAISNYRIVDFKDGKVVFSYQDYKDHDKIDIVSPMLSFA